MGTSSLVIVVTLGRAVGDIGLKDTTDPRGEARVLSKLFHRLSCGIEPGASFTVQTSANTPVKASGTVTLTYASIANNDTVTVGGTVLTCVTGTPSGAQFKKVTDGPTTAANLAALINANTTLNKLVQASAAAGVVTVTALAPGVVGNQITLATSNSSGFTVSAANLASGAGGVETAPVSYSRGA